MMRKEESIVNVKVDGHGPDWADEQTESREHAVSIHRHFGSAERGRVAVYAARKSKADGATRRQDLRHRREEMVDRRGATPQPEAAEEEPSLFKVELA